jgi:hypothetical protein
MLVQFDPSSLNVQLRVGILESYKPTKKTKDLLKKVEALQEKVEAFKKETIVPEVDEINKLVEEINKPFLPEAE